MLSDEEKKAIEYLKIEYEKLMKEDNILYYSDMMKLNWKINGYKI